MASSNSLIDGALYTRHDVKRGLRDLNGKGVLAGLTHIGDVQGQTKTGDDSVPGPGRLLYRGIDVVELVGGFLADNRSGFEETCYLLLFGELPARDELARFMELLEYYRPLPKNFVHDSILTLSSRDVMNAMAQSVLALYVLDEKADDTSIPNVLRQCLFLTAIFPLLAAYCYRAHAYHNGEDSLVIHSPLPGLSTAENFLRMIRDDASYSPLEASLLDLALVLHAEHGGGNNSSFAVHVVTSTGTDTYSTVAAALGSLKGPRHGGANIKVVQMFEDMKKNVTDWDNENQVADYLVRIVNKQAFDCSGLIYGVGHAVYSTSDPRAVVLHQQIRKLAEEKGLLPELRLYEKVEKLAPEIIGRSRKIYKGVSANVDFYSGLLYRLLNIPTDLYAPLFAVSRISGWSAHRIEELSNGGKIIRPAYQGIAPLRGYVPLESRRLQPF